MLQPIKWVGGNMSLRGKSGSGPPFFRDPGKPMMSLVSQCLRALVLLLRLQLSLVYLLLGSCLLQLS